MMGMMLLIASLAALFWIIYRVSRRDDPPSGGQAWPTHHLAPPVKPLDLGTCFARGLNDRLRINYVDRNGEETTRDVTVYEVWGKRGDKPGYVWVNWLVGQCHLRHDRRQFQTRNIMEIGEPAWVFTATGRRVEPWLADRYKVKRSDEVTAFRRGQPIERSVLSPPVIVEYIRSGGGEIERYEAVIDEVTAYPDGTVVRIDGKAHRPRTPTSRGWSGRKTMPIDYFGSRLVSIALAETGEVLPDPLQWLRDLPDHVPKLIADKEANTPVDLPVAETQPAAIAMPPEDFIPQPAPALREAAAPTAAALQRPPSPSGAVPRHLVPLQSSESKRQALPPERRTMPLGWIFATLGAVLLGAVLLRQQSYRPPPEPAPLAAPTPAPLPAPDMIIDGYWLGIGLGCHSDRAYALYIRTHLTDSLDRLFPEAARERARAQFEQGVRRGGLARDGLACERGLATLDRVRLPIMLTR